MSMGNHAALRQEDIKEVLAMAEKSAVAKKKRRDSKPMPTKQDVLSMLASWCEMALKVEMDIEQRYDPIKKRFVLRVEDVELGDDYQLLDGSE